MQTSLQVPRWTRKLSMDILTYVFASTLVITDQNLSTAVLYYNYQSTFRLTYVVLVDRIPVGQIHGNRQSFSQISGGNPQACARGASAPARSRVERLYPRWDDSLQQAALHPGVAWNRQRHEMEG